nr:MAG TPA: hypothetical protein [Bacteriophage sp.]DAS82871.1 MAG TPA: hypothetical protein [Caudoviricetes sp.]
MRCPIPANVRKLLGQTAYRELPYPYKYIITHFN